jgi:hypothetical protein
MALTTAVKIGSKTIAFLPAFRYLFIYKNATRTSAVTEQANPPESLPFTDAPTKKTPRHSRPAADTKPIVTQRQRRLIEAALGLENDDADSAGG